MPAMLVIDMTCWHPRYLCAVSDGKGTAYGGFRRYFKTHGEMFAWLERNGYRPTSK